LPEQELLERLRHYEDLLSKNNVQFESIDESGVDQPYRSTGDVNMDSVVDASSEKSSMRETSIPRDEGVYDTKYGRGFRVSVCITDTKLEASGML
jgi:hypothetical protein